MKRMLIIIGALVFSGCASIIPPTLAPTAKVPLRADKVSAILTNTPLVLENVGSTQSTTLPNDKADSSNEFTVLPSVDGTEAITPTFETTGTSISAGEQSPTFVATITTISVSPTFSTLTTSTPLNSTLVPTNLPATATSVLSIDTQISPSQFPTTQVPATNTSVAASETSIPDTDTPIAPTTTPIPQPSNTPFPQGCSPSQNSSFESQVISLINQERANEGLPALSNQSQLTTAARNHSEDMGCNGFFSHTSPTSGSPFDRINAAGYSYSWAGENIAAGYGNASQVVAGWMSSSGHRNNILSPNFTQTGVGYVYISGSAYGSYWTQTFGSP